MLKTFRGISRDTVPCATIRAEGTVASLVKWNNLVHTSIRPQAATKRIAASTNDGIPR